MLASNFSRPLLFAVAALVLGAAALWFLPTLPIQLNPPAPAETPAAAEPGRDTAPPVPAVEPTPSEMPLGAASADREYEVLWSYLETVTRRLAEFGVELPGIALTTRRPN